MKTPFLKQIFFGILAVALSLLSSCASDKDTEPILDAAFLNEQSKITAIYDEVDNIILYAMQNNGLGLRTTFNVAGDFCDDTQVDLNESAKRITIDFGENCTSPNGINRKGKIILTYTGVFWIPGTVVTTTFEDYSVNGKKLEGTRTITNKELNIFENFIVLETIITNGKVTWTDGTSATINLNQNRTIYIPSGNDEIRIEVTGNANGKSRSGIDYTSEIIDDLKFFQSCTDTGNWIPSNGNLKVVTANDVEYLVDYGAGQCDRNAVVSFGSQTINITFD